MARFGSLAVSSETSRLRFKQGNIVIAAFFASMVPLLCVIFLPNLDHPCRSNNCNISFPEAITIAINCIYPAIFCLTAASVLHYQIKRRKLWRHLNEALGCTSKRIWLKDSTVEAWMVFFAVIGLLLMLATSFVVSSMFMLYA